MPVSETLALPAGITDPGYNCARTFCSRQGGEMLATLDAKSV